MKIVILLASCFAALASATILSGKTLSPTQVAERWGKSEFKIEKFKNAAMDTRAKMTADLIKNQPQFHGKDANEIRSLLGPFSGHYVSESYPTYLIQKGTEQKPESWQIVFAINRNNLVKDIVVHKNCCDQRKVFRPRC